VRAAAGDASLRPLLPLLAAHAGEPQPVAHALGKARLPRLGDEQAARALSWLRVSCPPLHRALLAPFVAELARRGEIPSLPPALAPRSDRAAEHQ
jgi:hypothetical protein